MGEVVALLPGSLFGCRQLRTHPLDDFKLFRSLPAAPEIEESELVRAFHDLAAEWDALRGHASAKLIEGKSESVCQVVRMLERK